MVGADSLLNAVLAIVRAKSYIETDNIDLQFWPDFVHLQVRAAAGQRRGPR